MNDNALPWKIATGIFALLFLATLLNTNLFSSEADITGNVVAGQGKEAILAIAESIGADASKIEDCLDSGKYDSKLALDTQRARNMGLQGTPAFYVNGVEISGAQPYSALETAIEAALAGTKGDADMTLYADDAIKGSRDAKVSVILYSDPSCPFCAAAAGGSEMVAYMASEYGSYEAAVPGIIENYVNTGKANIVFRYFPGHGSGTTAMKAMFCANEQNLFWEMHDLIFDNQEAVSD